MSSDDMSNIKEALKQAVEMTFMNMAFVDVMEAEEPAEVNFSHIIHISFSSPVEGGMILFLPTACKKMIAENIHGSNWESLSTDEIDDCLLELLNVLAGNFLNIHYGKEVGHNMTFPQLLFDESEVPEHGDYRDYFFDAEGVPFKIGLWITG
jgi:hypothetical protein